MAFNKNQHTVPFHRFSRLFTDLNLIVSLGLLLEGCPLSEYISIKNTTPNILVLEKIIRVIIK